MPKKNTSKGRKPAPPAHVPTIQFVDSPPTEQELASAKAVQVGVIEYPVTNAPPVRRSNPWTGPTTQAAIAAKFKVKSRTVRRWANSETKGPVEVKKAGSMFYHRPWPD